MKKPLAFLNLVCVITGGFYYLKLSALSPKQFFAICPQAFVLAACFVVLFIGSGFLKSFLVPTLLYYGITGLFLYPWKGIDLLSQALHILMLANAFYFLLITVFKIQLIRLFLGLVFGLGLIVGSRFYQIKMLNENPDIAKSYLPKVLHPVKRIRPAK